MNEAFVLLNVDFKHQPKIIDAVKKITTVKNVKTTYGMYDILLTIESDNMQEIKKVIDVDLRKIEGINNLTSLISIN